MNSVSMLAKALSRAACTIVIVGGALAPVPALAFGGTSNAPVHKCSQGKVWSNSAKKCVAANSGLLPDDELIEQGRQLAVAGYYDEAIGVLQAVSSKVDPLALTYLGYSYRKIGDVEHGMALYHKALRFDPDSVVTHEYLGEGYAEAGEIELALAELARVKDLCGTQCEEYRDLAEAIDRVAIE